MTASDETKARAEELNNSSLFDVHRWSDYPEVNNAVNDLYGQLKEDPSFSGNTRIRKKHVKVIILDLFVKWKQDPQMYASYSRGKTSYSEIDQRYNNLHISFITVAIVDALAKAGYVDQVIGHYDKTGKRQSHMARMRATAKLIDLIATKHKITPKMIELAPNTECIILRDKNEEKKEDIAYVDTSDRIKMREELYNYNNLLRTTLIDIPYIPQGGLLEKAKKTIGKKKGETRTTINRSDKFVRRIFSNGTFADGGRFYGGFWQRVPKKWRERISINACHTVEIDYSGLHVVILYALEGIDYWKEVGTDPYDIPKAEKSDRMRQLLKLILLCILNNNDKATTIKAIMNKINFDPEEFSWVKEDKVDISDIIDNFCSVHKPIEKHFYTGVGIKLQNIDSRIAEYVINSLTNKDIPVLCIHDSFVVQTGNEKTLRDSMDLAFKNELSIINPKTKTIGIDTTKLAKAQVGSMSSGSEYNLWETISNEYGVDLSDTYSIYLTSTKNHNNNSDIIDNYYHSPPVTV